MGLMITDSLPEGIFLASLVAVFHTTLPGPGIVFAYRTIGRDANNYTGTLGAGSFSQVKQVVLFSTSRNRTERFLSSGKNA